MTIAVASSLNWPSAATSTAAIENTPVTVTSPGAVYRDLIILGCLNSEGLPAAPGDIRAARITRTARDPVWDGFYMPLAGAVVAMADRMNVLQFLTIRRYLGFVFAALVLLLMGLTLWQ